MSFHLIESFILKLTKVKLSSLVSKIRHFIRDNFQSCWRHRLLSHFPSSPHFSLQLRGWSRIFWGGGALVSCSTSTPVNHIVQFFFLQNTGCIRKPQVISGGGGTPCTLPLDPPLQLVSQKQSKPTLLNRTESYNHQINCLLTRNIINRVGHCLDANSTNKLHNSAKIHQPLQQPHPPAI